MGEYLSILVYENTVGLNVQVVGEISKYQFSISIVYHLSGHQQCQIMVNRIRSKGLTLPLALLSYWYCKNYPQWQAQICEQQPLLITSVKAISYSNRAYPRLQQEPNQLDSFFAIVVPPLSRSSSLLAFCAPGQARYWQSWQSPHAGCMNKYIRWVYAARA